MSYEGYNQCICEAGHYFERYEGEECVCDEVGCGKPPVWSNPVDTTNCDNWGIIPDSLIKKALVEPLKVVEVDGRKGYLPELYRSPTEEETASWRHFKSWKDNTLYPCKK